MRVPKISYLIVFLLVPIIFGMWWGYFNAIQSLNKSLTHRLGLPVSITDIRGGYDPVIILEKVRIGDTNPKLVIDRMDIHLDWQWGNSPEIREVHLFQPALYVQKNRGEQASRWNLFTPSHSNKSLLASVLKFNSKLLTKLKISDGRLQISGDWTGHLVVFASEGIFLERSQHTSRLVLGKSSLSLDKTLFLDVAATAFDLFVGHDHDYWPRRIASLGGKLRWHNTQGQIVLSLHTFSAQQHSDSFEIQIKGKTQSQEAGDFTATAQIDFSSTVPRLAKLNLGLHQVSLSQFKPFLKEIGIQLIKGEVNGNVEVAENDHDHDHVYYVKPSLQFDKFQISHPLFSRLPLGPMRSDFKGEFSFNPRQRWIQLAHAQFTAGELSVLIDGKLQVQPDRTKLALDVQLPETPCQKILAALPTGLTSHLRGMIIAGTFGLRGHLRLDSSDWDNTQIAINLKPLHCKVTSDPPLANVNELMREKTIQVKDTNGNSKPWTLGPSNPNFFPLAKISSHLKSAFIVAEDASFYKHDGFDGPLLRHAFISNLKQGRLLRGASTISQQLIKNIYLGHERNIVRKIQEAVLTWRLEQVVPKSRILELYLNLVEMGPGIYGVGQATRQYFGRPPNEITPLQAAYLAAITPSPRSFANQLHRGAPDPAWIERVQLLLRLMKRMDHSLPATGKSLSAENLSLFQRMRRLSLNPKLTVSSSRGRKEP